MGIVVLCIYSVILSMLAYVFFAFVNVDDEKIEITDIKSRLLENKKTILYICLMLLCLVVMSFELSIVYNNSILKNSKLITLVAILFVVALTDFRKYIIPNTVILFGIAARFVFYGIELFAKPQAFFEIIKGDLLASLIVIVFLIVGAFVVKNGLGMGDIKLIIVMCLFQGFYGVICSLFFSLIIAFFLSIGLLIMRKKTRKDAIPFAPSILVGTLISVFLTGM